MAVADYIKASGKTVFSFELLPPLKGKSIEEVFASIDMLREFDPQYINITTHHSETVFKDMGNGLYERQSVCRRPGTVAVAAAIKNRYNIPVVPHILCSGISRQQTEYILLDLQFLGITDVLVLRGDKNKEDSSFVAAQNGWRHALELEQQINDFNQGRFVDGSSIAAPVQPFHFGVAGYPEKHEEAPNMDQDLFWLKKKVEAGAEYVVTQMFYDNQKFFSFVQKARQCGINVPIIPGIKPFSKISQLTMLPRVFNVDLPQALVEEAIRCQSDAELRSLGIEWCIAQCRELIAAGVPGIHFYTVGAVDKVREVARAIY